MARDKSKKKLLMKCSLVKRVDLFGRKPALRATKSDPIVEFQFIDNGDSTVQVMGVSAAGNPVDISEVATLTPPPVSSDTSILTVDPPVGMTFVMHAMGPLTPPGNPVIISITATWIDGSLGPYEFEMPVYVVLGIVVTPGAITAR